VQLFSELESHVAIISCARHNNTANHGTANGYPDVSKPYAASRHRAVDAPRRGAAPQE